MSGIAYDELGTRLRLYKGISGNAAAAKDSLKILVLHGFGSTAEACKRQVRPLFDSLDTVCELHFIDGMHEAPQLLAMMFGSSSGNAWWSMHPSSSTTSQGLTKEGTMHDWRWQEKQRSLSAQLAF